MKTQYDFAFPLGSACATSLALRAANLQFASLPFDWTGGGDIVGRAKIVADDFRDWFRMEDLELIDVQHATFNSSIYRNRRTGLVYSHDFPAACYLEDEYPGIALKYDRRVKRLYSEIAKAKRVLAVYNEIPYRPVASDSALLAAQRILAMRFPEVRIDLVYFAQDPECRNRPPRIVSENVTSHVIDYHSIAQGYVCVAATYHLMIERLGGAYMVPDARTPEQIVQMESRSREREVRRWGSGLTRWINKRAYHFYRHLERFLVRRGCVPSSERPLKIYADRGERKRAVNSPDVSFLPRDEEAAQHAYDLL